MRKLESISGDAEATKEIKKADTVTAKLPDDSKPPKTDDNSSVMLWAVLFFVIGGAVICTKAVDKRKSSTVDKQLN